MRDFKKYQKDAFAGRGKAYTDNAKVAGLERSGVRRARFGHDERFRNPVVPFTVGANAGIPCGVLAFILYLSADGSNALGTPVYLQVPR